jgi:hypothetical protein
MARREASGTRAMMPHISRHIAGTLASGRMFPTRARRSAPPRRAGPSRPVGSWSGPTQDIVDSCRHEHPGHGCHPVHPVRLPQSPDDRRAERARGVHAGTSERPAHQRAEADRKTHGQGREPIRHALVRRHRHDHEHQAKESSHSTPNALPGSMFGSVAPSRPTGPRTPSKLSDASTAPAHWAAT